MVSVDVKLSLFLLTNYCEGFDGRQSIFKRHVFADRWGALFDDLMTGFGDGVQSIS